MKTQRQRRRRFARWWILPAVMASLLLLLWFAPALIGNSLKDYLLSQATQGVAGRVSVGSIALGWLSPLQLRETTVDDAEGNRLLDAAVIRTDRTLLQLLMDQQNLGHWTVERPRLRIATRGETSNLEQLIASLPSSGANKPASIPQIQFDLVDGQLEMVNSQSGQTLLVTHLQGTLVTPAGGQGEATVELTGATYTSVTPQEVDAQTQVPGPIQDPTQVQSHFQLKGQFALERDAAEIPAGRLEFQCQQLDLAVLGPVLARLQPDLQIFGTLTADAQLAWAAAVQLPQVELRMLEGREIQVVWPSRFGAETLRLPYLRGQGGAQLDGDVVSLRQLAIDCQLARIEADGRLSLTALQSAAAQSGDSAALAAQEGRLVGHVDLAQVAAIMPGLLHVREDTRIESGLVQLEIVSRGDAAGHTWTGRLASSELSAIRGNQRLVWPQPLELTANIQRTPTGIFVERLQCQGTFLQLEAAGTLDRASLQATADLDQLVTELDRFLDLGEITLQGKVRSGWNWVREPDNTFRLSGDLTAENLRLLWPGGRPWQESRLELALTAAGQLDSTLRLQRLDAAQFTLQAANGDQLSAQLVEPVKDFGLVDCSLTGKASGDLPAWLSRLQTICPLPGYSVQGTFTAELAGRVRSDAAEVSSARVVADNLRLVGQGLFIDEPRVEAAGRASWQQATGRLDVPDATLAMSSVSVRASETRIETQDASLGAQGRLALSGDLNRMMSWVRDPAVPATLLCNGQVDGRLTLVQQDDKLNISGDTVLTSLIVRRRNETASAVASTQPGSWTTIWQEPRLALEARGDVRIADQRLMLESLKIEGSQSGLAGQVKGSVEQWSQRMLVDLQGELTYDLEQVVDRMRELVGPQLQLTGREQRAFQLKGPLLPSPPAAQVAGGNATGSSPGGSSPWVPAELTGQASLGWQGANYLGMQVGQGQLQARLQDATLNIDPLDLVVSQGRLLMKPHIDFRRDPALLVLEPGQVIQQMQISPEMCRSWLKFVAPLLADATRAEGQFSLDLQQAALPLGQPQQATVMGKLVVHAARVGPGPLAQQLLVTADQMQALLQQKLPTGKLSSSTNWITMPAQAIDIQVLEGRVYHRGLQLVIDDIIIQTEGSVGLDETIQMEAQVPIRQQWIEGRRWLAGFQGHVVRVPIRGTLSQPKVDNRAMQNFAGQTLKQAAGQALQQELGRGLKQLFTPSSGN